jgi:hypothetical protein
MKNVFDKLCAGFAITREYKNCSLLLAAVRCYCMYKIMGWFFDISLNQAVQLTVIR